MGTGCQLEGVNCILAGVFGSVNVAPSTVASSPEQPSQAQNVHDRTSKSVHESDKEMEKRDLRYKSHYFRIAKQILATFFQQNTC